MDYFTIGNSTSNDKQYFTYMKDKEIKEIFNLENPLMQWVIKRIEGMTIALEPEHTGSVNKSMKCFNLLEKQFFNSSVFQWKTTWRHLKNKTLSYFHFYKKKCNLVSCESRSDFSII